MSKSKILFICKDAAVHSLMAAAFLNTYFGSRYEACCAGIEPTQTNANAAKALKEIGIDISCCNPKKIEDLQQDKFDCVITLCDYAKTHLSKVPEHKKELHKSFKNFCLPALCANSGKLPMCFPENNHAADNTLAAFRFLREEIFNWVENEAVF